jgi:UDP-glucose 4-epimerase
MQGQILVTGGCGYIGSFMVRALKSQGYTPIVIDNLERGKRDTISPDISFYQGNVSDRELLNKIHLEHQILGVIHFAGYISMKESTEKPELYFEKNTHETKLLLDNLISIGIKKIIFSSTAGVYGNPERVPIKEDDKKEPTNPYGESKLMSEKMLHWYQKAHNIDHVILRYFNACGADLNGDFGESHNPETHIIPVALNSMLDGAEFSIYGNDYNTPDGTCVRDYIHVLDLVNAHLLALERILKESGGYTYNVGTGQGYSNKEIVSMIEQVTGKNVKVIDKERRPGDADALVADVGKIKEELNFEPKYSDLRTIIDSAWKWHSKTS